MRTSKGKRASRVIFKRDSSLAQLYQGYRRETKCSGILTCHGLNNKLDLFLVIEDKKINYFFPHALRI